ncbi:VPS9 domain-containing protein 1 [Holothuria leucospilota]|uniref:VPS9 domain-containing protein 1 n=1 Tax=Holothuria leucospilota TaxID=206669 RepID=A0A9Q1CC26_HOLLE|nr:VPS9 domain-containing protein 1 [Holothuria leucospilota]
MASPQQNLNLKPAMKYFVQAMKLDETGNNQDAYVEYLSCLQFISGTLFEDAKRKAMADPSLRQKDGKINESALQLHKENQHQQTEVPQSYQQPHIPSSSGPTSDLRDPSRTIFGPHQKPQYQQPSPPSKPLPPSPTHSVTSKKRSFKQLSPMEKAYHENRILMEAYSARLKRISGSKHQSSVSLTFQRRLMENMAIAKEREKQLAMKIRERHMKLQKLAAEKFSRSGPLSRDDLELHNTYARILEYDNRNLWLQELHEKLRASSKDAPIIQDLIGHIIAAAGHPFSQLMKYYQDVILEKLRPLLENHTCDDVRVPLDGVPVLELCEHKVIKVNSFKDSKTRKPMFNDDFMTRLLAFRNSAKYEEMLHEVGQDIISWEGDEMFEELIDELVMESSEILVSSESLRERPGDGGKVLNGGGENDEVKEEEEETPATVVQTFREITTKIRDDLKDAVEMGEDLSNHKEGDESGYDEYSVDGEEDGQLEGSSIEKRDEDVDATGSQEEEGLEDEGEEDAGKEESDTQDSGEQQSESDTQSVSSSRRESDMSETEEEKVRQKLVSLLVAVYEELATAVAKDQCLTIIEYHFFPGIWKALFAFFRRVNYDRELQIATAMTRYQDALPEHIGIPLRFCLKGEANPIDYGDSFPYANVVEELQNVSKYDCPADKLDCLGEGCDDLLPILSYIILKSAIPAVVSEISAMEIFIQEGYLFGKEGYCLTTMQTAMSYVFRLSEE